MSILNHLHDPNHGIMTPNKRAFLSLIALSLVISACTGKIEDPATEAGSNSNAGEQPIDEQPIDEQPIGEQPIDEQPIDEQPIDEQPIDEQPIDEQPIDEQPIDEQPTQVSLDELDRTPIEQENESEEVTLIAPELVAVLERPRRRMNLDQLDRAIRQVSGGLIWSERRNNQDQNLFESLSATLGKPDFIQRTSEDLSPSALFMKFLDDASRQVCGKRIEIDLAAANDPRSEVTSADIQLWGTLSPELTSTEDTHSINQQIRALVLRFHSRTLPEGESTRLAYWRWLFETASLVDQDSISGWRALCIGLINHPDFYSY